MLLRESREIKKIKRDVMSLLNNTFEITITDYSKKGHGLAFLSLGEGQTPIQVEVPSTSVGDHLEVALAKHKKGLYRGKLLKIVRASHLRTQPRCEHAHICGGCSWQHIDYQSQISQKEKAVQAFAESFPGAVFYPIIPATSPWHYRNKMEFSFSENQEGEKFLGLVKTHSRGKVINLNQCHLVSPWFIQVTQKVIDWWNTRSLKSFHPPSGKGTLRTLTVREGMRTGKKMIFLTISGDHEYFVTRPDLTSFKRAILQVLPEDNPSIYIRIHKAEKNRPTTFYEIHLHGPDCLHEMLYIRGRAVHFHISPASFFQPNTLQAEKLYERALDFAAPNASMRIYDLYAGCGSIGMIFAPFVKKVLGIEQCAHAVCDAKVNIATNQLDNVTMMCGNVGDLLSEEMLLHADLIILNPPRSGLDTMAMKQLLRIQCKKLIYISCNLLTHSKNILELTQHGYRLKAIQPIDQFPHTPHIEMISLLEK